MNNLERINQQIQGLEFNLNMMKGSAVSEELASEIETLTSQLEQLNKYKAFLSVNEGLGKLYEQRKNASNSGEVASIDQQIDEYYSNNAQTLSQAYLDEIKAINPEFYKNIDGLYGVKVVTPEEIRKESEDLASDVEEIQTEEVAPSVTYDEVQNLEQDSQEIETVEPEVVEEATPSISTYEEAEQAYMDALDERNELYNQLTDLGEIPRNHDTDAFMAKRAEIDAMDDRIAELGQRMADLSSPQEEIAVEPEEVVEEEQPEEVEVTEEQEEREIPSSGGLTDATGDAYGDTPEEQERLKKDIVLGKYDLEQVKSVLANYSYLKDEDVCLTINNVELTVGDFKERLAKLEPAQEPEMESVEIFSGDIGEGMPSVEEQFKQGTGIDFDPAKHEVVYDGAHDELNDEPFTPFTVVEKQPVKEAELESDPFDQNEQTIEPEVELVEEVVQPVEEVVEEVVEPEKEIIEQVAEPEEIVEATPESKYGEGGVQYPAEIKEDVFNQVQQPNEVEIPEPTEVEEIRPEEVVQEQPEEVVEEERTSSSRLTRNDIIQDRELDNPDYVQTFNAPGMTDEEIERARAEIDAVPLAQPPVEEEPEENRVVESVPAENKPQWDKRLTNEQILDALSKDIYEPVGQEYEQYLREVGLDPIKESQTETKVEPEVVEEVTESETHTIDNTFIPTPPPVNETETRTVEAPEETQEAPVAPVDDNPQHKPNPETGFAVGGFQAPAVVGSEEPEVEQVVEEEPAQEEPEQEPEELDEPERYEVPGPSNTQLHGRSLERILYELTLDDNNETMDLSKGQRKAITRSRINVTKSFVSRIKHKNLIYNITGVTSSIIPMIGQTFSRWINKAYTVLHPKAVKNYDTIVQKLNELSDADLEVLRTQLTANKAQEYRSYIAIMPLVNNRIAQYIEEKYNAPLRQEIFEIQSELMERYREIDRLDRLYATLETEEEKDEVMADIDAISSGSVELITRLNELKLELSHNLEGGPGIHTLQESSKVVDNNSGDLGKAFSHKKTLKESEAFNQDQADLGDQLVAAINAGNDVDALYAFGDKEINEFNHTHNKKIGFDRFSDGDYNWRIMPKRLDYGNDPLLGYVFTTISTIGLAKGILTEIHNQGVRREIEAANNENIGVNNQIEQANQQNLTANQQNLNTIDQVHSTGRTLEGRSGDYVQGIEHMSRDSVVSNRTAGEYNAGDATNWSFNSEYRTLDHASHESVHALYDQANASFESIKQGLQDGTLTNADAIREAQNALAAVEEAKMTTYAAFRETMNTYCPAHPQHDYEPLMNYMDDIVNNPTVINRMVDGMQESVANGVLLQQAVMQVYSPVAAVVKTLPDNIQSFILPLVTQAAITGYLNRNAGRVITNHKVEHYEDYMQELYEDINEEQENARTQLEEQVRQEQNEQENTQGEPEQEEEQENTQGEPEQEEQQENTQGEPEQEKQQENTQGEPEQEEQQENTQGEPEQQETQENTQGEPAQAEQAAPAPTPAPAPAPAPAQPEANAQAEQQGEPEHVPTAADDEVVRIELFDDATLITFADGEEVTYIISGNEDLLKQKRSDVFKTNKVIIDDDLITFVLPGRTGFFRPIKDSYEITENTVIQDFREGLNNEAPEQEQGTGRGR